MLSNQILHKTVQDIKRITGFECAVWDMRGICLVMTSEKMIGLDKRILMFCETVVEEPMRIEADVGMFLYTGAGGRRRGPFDGGRDGSQPAVQSSVCL